MNVHPNRGALDLQRVALSTVLVLVLAVACAKESTGPAVTPLANKTLANLQAIDLAPVRDDWNDPSVPFDPYGSLYSMIKETVPDDDATYFYRNRMGLPAVTSEARIWLDTLPTGVTPDPSQRHTVLVRWKCILASGFGGCDTSYPNPTALQYGLMLGNNTLIAQRTVYPSGQSYITDSVAVTPSLITDYNNLKIWFRMTLKPTYDGSDQIQGRVTWARLQIR